MTTINPTPESVAAGLQTVDAPRFLPRFSNQLAEIGASREAREYLRQADDLLAMVLDIGLYPLVQKAAPLEWAIWCDLHAGTRGKPALALFSYTMGVVAVRRSGIAGEVADELSRRMESLLLTA